MWGILEAHCSTGKGDAADQDPCQSGRVAAAADQPTEAEILQIKGIAALHHDVRDEALIRFERQWRLEEQLADQASGAVGNRSFPTAEVGIVLMREDPPRQSVRAGAPRFWRNRTCAWVTTIRLTSPKFSLFRASRRSILRSDPRRPVSTTMQPLSDFTR
jgi:hypothetical protein